MAVVANVLGFVLFSNIVLGISDQPSKYYSDEPVRYDNYRIYSVLVETQEQVNLLEKVTHNDDRYGVLSLSLAHRIGEYSTVLVAPTQLNFVQTSLRGVQATLEETVSNVQDHIDEERLLTAKSTSFDWTAYQTLESISAWLEGLPAKYPHLVSAIQVATSYEKRPVRGVRINSDSGRTEKPAIAIDCGIHAREWIAPAFCTYFIEQLLTSKTASIGWIRDKLDVYIVPVLNPDGYHFSHVGDRLWRKTRKPYGVCIGADGNRNWDINWAQTNSTPCMDTYRGPKPFSEPEISGYRDFLSAFGTRMRTYISMHSYSQRIFYPYGYSKLPEPNGSDLHRIAKAAAEALKRRHGTVYEFGPLHSFGRVNGSSMDYVYKVLSVPLSFGYELRPSNDSKYKFLLPADEIIAVGEETTDSIVALIAGAAELGYYNY